MAERKNTHGLRLTRRRDVMIVDIGDMEIWDGADLSLIRDTLNRLILKQRRRAIGIQMRAVKYVPSGFFGMLYDWFEQGISVRLFSPQPRVANMLWFQRFFEAESKSCYVLRENLHAFVEIDEESEGQDSAGWLREHEPELSAVHA
jgi:hypothetical protein